MTLNSTTWIKLGMLVFDFLDESLSKIPIAARKARHFIVYFLHSVTIIEMMKREQLQHLSEAYLKFLIMRDETGLKSFLSLDFQMRLRVSQQLRLIKTLPTALNYGISPEAHLWTDYVIEQNDGQLFLSPFQFDVSYRNLMNPLLGETMTVTVHSLVLENNNWKIASVLSEPDHSLLLHYSAKNKVSDKDPAGPDRKTQPKK